MYLSNSVNILCEHAILSHCLYLRSSWPLDSAFCDENVKFQVSAKDGISFDNSWGTKERFWLTLAPENNTAKLYMVEKVIIWGI